MQRGFGGTAFEPLEERQDKELTLGPVMLTALVTGLLALCSICFFAGYAVGHHSSPAPDAAATQPAASTPAAPLVASNQPKPLAAQSVPQPQPAAVTDAVMTSDAANPNPASASASTPSAGTPTQPLVRAALPVQAGAVQPVSANGQTVQPALVPPTAWMVQIAAVAQQEDADVLVAALRRRGYAVSAHRDPADGQLHVRVGPFATHTDAATMRQKLMNDGYNAIIQP